MAGGFFLPGEAMEPQGLRKRDPEWNNHPAGCCQVHSPGPGRMVLSLRPSVFQKVRLGPHFSQGTFLYPIHPLVSVSASLCQGLVGPQGLQNRYFPSESSDNRNWLIAPGSRSC